MTENNINMTTNQNVGLNQILKIVYIELLWWFSIITIIFIGIFTVAIYKDKNIYLDYFKSPTDANTNLFCGTFNPETYIFDLTMILCLIIIILLVAMVLLNGKDRENVTNTNFQMILFMFLSTIILCIYIFLTGGFLDSPFSSALSIYLAGFLLIQDRKDLKKINYIIVIFTTSIIFAPYLIYSYYNIDDNTYFFNYSKNDSIVNIRLILSFGLALYSIYMGQRINNKINGLYVK